jgi:hypothetical protein
LTWIRAGGRRVKPASREERGLNIHQEVTIDASPAAVYGVLTSSADFAK